MVHNKRGLKSQNSKTGVPRAIWHDTWLWTRIHLLYITEINSHRPYGRGGSLVYF